MRRSEQAVDRHLGISIVLQAKKTVRRKDNHPIFTKEKKNGMVSQLYFHIFNACCHSNLILRD